jgi:transposase
MRTKTQKERDLRKKAIKFLLLSGMNHREIALSLNISASIVSYYRSEITNEFISKSLKHRTGK